MIRVWAFKALWQGLALGFRVSDVCGRLACLTVRKKFMGSHVDPQDHVRADERDT